jgi:hypothetical protein
MQISLPGGSRADLFPQIGVVHVNTGDRLLTTYRCVVPVLREGLWYGVFFMTRRNQEAASLHHQPDLVTPLMQYLMECHIGQNNFEVTQENLTDFEKSHTETEYEKRKIGLVFRIRQDELIDLAEADLIEYKYITKTL